MHIQEPYKVWRCLQHPSSLYMKAFLGSEMTSIKTEATNGLVINQVNVSNSIQIILTKFAVTVIRFQFTYFIFKHFNTRRVFNFCRYHAPNFLCKISANEFKPNFVVLTVFLKNAVCDLKF